jgi:pimeloyl-ACP methyl ester carboxylesterase
MEKSLNLTGYKCQTIYSMFSGVPILLLHGLSYNSGIWQCVKLTDALVEKHVPFLALDMPYGLKSKCQPKTRNPDINTKVAAEAVSSFFGSAVPFVVGASLGGYIALKYAASFPVKGLFLVAPAYALENELTHVYSKFNFPVRIVWGSNDSVISGEEMRTLVDKLPNSRLLMYEGAGHSAYKDQPERFKRDLLQLYATVE